MRARAYVHPEATASNTSEFVARLVVPTGVHFDVETVRDQRIPAGMAVVVIDGGTSDGPLAAEAPE